jgi:undecaprenyl diphosphate synthase
MPEPYSLVHVAIIPDGNRRWATKHNLSSLEGHREGYSRAKELLREARAQKIQYLTFWSFSTENWLRGESEVKDLLRLIYTSLVELRKEVRKEKTRFLHIGRKDRLDGSILKLIVDLQEETKEYTDFCVCVAIDYGGEDELKRACSKLQNSQDTTKTLTDFLDTSLLSIPNPDFIIRTSGEKRTSGFMSLQSVYSEWCFEPLLFPEFTAEHFKACLIEYCSRARRFGK